MLRPLLFLFAIAICSSSCRSLRAPAKRSTSTSSERRSAPLNTATVPAKATGSKRVYKDVRRANRKNIERKSSLNPYVDIKGDIETSDRLQFKYSLLTDVPVEALKDLVLLNYLDSWYGTPYRYGGSTHTGIDCSAFTMDMMDAVFRHRIPRTVMKQYEGSRRIDREDLRYGDLVFFNTSGSISHVGIYLMNDKFAHASTSSGVIISDLDEEYFARRFEGGGRVNNFEPR